MSSALSDSTGRARSRMARSLFLMFWSLSLLPVLILGSLGYMAGGVTGTSWGLVAAILVGLIALLGGLSLWLARRVAKPVQVLVDALSRFTEGDWEQRVTIERDDEIGELAHLFNTVADEMKEIYNLLSIREGDEPGGEKRSGLMQLAQMIDTAADLDELQRGALEMIVKMFACSFAALYLIERVEPVGVNYAVLAKTYGRLEGLPGSLGKRFSETRINLDATPTMEWMVGKALASRRAQVGPAGDAPAVAGMPGVMEATLPLIRRSPEGGERLVGVLDLYAGSRISDSRLGPFANRPLSELQSIANLMALAISCMSSPARPGPAPADKPGVQAALAGATTPAGNDEQAAQELDPGAARGGAPRLAGEAAAPRPSAADTLSATPSLLPLAGATLETFFTASREIAQAMGPEQVLMAAGGALRQSPFVNALLIPNRSADGAPVFEVIDCRREPASMRSDGQPDLAVAPLQAFFATRQGILVIVDDIGKRLNDARAASAVNSGENSAAAGALDGAATAPLALLEVAQRIGAEAAAFIPVMGMAESVQWLEGVLVVGRPPRPALRNLQSPPLNPVLLEPYANLAYLAIRALERVYDQGGAQRRLAELESLWQVSQTIAAETHLEAVFPILHHQLETVMGKLTSFATMIYNQETNLVHLPYFYSNGNLLDIPSFPLGNSLTSHVIRSREPMLLRDQQSVEAMSQQVGLMQVGQPAQSWLGVPMLFGGEVLGAIVVQDVSQEYRFDEDDQRLLSTLATQAAVVVRNARLLEGSQRQVQHEQLVNEISDRIRRAVDVQSILKTTADELGRALGAGRAHIQIAVGETAAASGGGTTQGSLAAPAEESA